VEVLRALLEANGLRRENLVSIFGAESLVSEVLHKKRKLNESQIEKLSRRFRVSPAACFPEKPLIDELFRTGGQRLSSQFGRVRG